MSQILTGFFFDIGGRKIYEDRVDAQLLETADGQSLAVGVVADGVGGANQGERAAQLAKDTLLEALRTRPEKEISALLSAAVQDANRAVYGEFSTTGGASTTLAVAAVDASNTLYIANVGDSRVYLCRNDKLTQLTIDHTFANVMPWQGKMSAELARENPRAEVLMLALGPKPKITVDVGFYVNTTDYSVAGERGRAGLPLKEGDSILVCSDGLIKNSSQTGQPFTTPDEIIRVLSTQEGEKAARSLVSFALGRNPEDNISVAVLQMPDPARHQRAIQPMRLARIAIGALALLLVVALLAFSRARANSQREQEQAVVTQTAAAAIAAQTADAQAETIGLLASQATGTAEAAAATIEFIASIPPTPTPTPTHTPTPRPTPIPGQIGYFFTGNESGPFTLDSPLPAADDLLMLEVDSSDGQLESSHIFAGRDSELEFAAVDAVNQRVSFRLSPGSDVFVQAGDYVNEVFTLGSFQGIIQADPGSCLSVSYPADEEAPVTVSCHAGECNFRLGNNERTPLGANRQLVYDPQDGTSDVTAIPAQRMSAYRGMLTGFPGGTAAADACGLPRALALTPTPTMTPTATRTLPPTPTDTPPPRSTDTPRPTDTPEPPTDTPEPPTDTPEPPTDTPEPTRPTGPVTPQPRPTSPGP